MGMIVNKSYIKRHRKGFVICHWLNAVSFFMLFLTALPLYIPSFGDFYRAVGPYYFQVLHRAFGVLYLATPVIGLFIARNGYKRLITEATHFTKEDIEFQKKFPPELIGGQPDLPKQGFYNGGEKMNILLQAALWVVLAVTGVILWFGVDWSPVLRTWAIPIHSIAAGVGFAAALGHAYLAFVVNPDSVHGMKDGTVKAAYALHHHESWVDELVRDGKVTREEVEAAAKH